MKPILPINAKVDDPSILLDQEVSDARKHKIQLLRSAEPKWYKEDFIRNQNIETLRKSEGIISSTVTDFRLSSEKLKVDKMIDIYERHKSKHSIHNNSASPDRKNSTQSKLSTKTDEKRIIFQNTPQKLSPKLDLRNMRTVADFRKYSRNHVPTLPEHKKHINFFKKKVGMMIETLNIRTQNPYKILQSLVSNLGSFNLKLPNHKDQRVNLPVKIEDEEGNIRDMSIRINTQKFEKHLLEKYSTRILQNKDDTQNIIKKMTKEYTEFLNKLVNKGVVIKIPMEFKVSLDDFNDYYTRKTEEEIEEEIRAEEERQKAAAEKTVEEEIINYIEEQVSEIEDEMIPTEPQLTTEEDTDNQIYESPPIVEVQTERALTINELKPVIEEEEEIKPVYTQRTYYEEEEDEEEFQRRQEEKKRKRQQMRKGEDANMNLRTEESGQTQTTKTNQTAEELMRKNIQEYIDKLDQEIQQQEQRFPSDPHRTSLDNIPSQTALPSQKNLSQVQKGSVSQPTIISQSQTSISDERQRQTLNGVRQYATNTNFTQAIASQPNIATIPEEPLNPKSKNRSLQTTDMLIINAAYEAQKALALSGTGIGTGTGSGTNKSNNTKANLKSRQKTSGGGNNSSTDGKSGDESPSRTRQSKRASAKSIRGSTKSSASEQRSKYMEYEKYDRASLIQLLLEAPSILDSDIKIRDHGDPPKIPDNLKFENDHYKKLFGKVYTWHHHLNRELKFQESELHIDKIISSEDSDKSGSDEDDF